ncbi:MAG TPA: cold shock domain-containing protein [Taishania sp.]|nr:cold shock domain-containing protein [Taishania sp.]
MQEGTVKFFNETKGFGFINDANSGQDVFVHISGLVNKIAQDDRVSFDVEETQKGLSAINVRIIR